MFWQRHRHAMSKVQTYKRMSRVENYFSMMLTKSGISDNVFFGNLPAVLKSEWKEMVLVDVQAVHDYDAYAKCSVNVFLYAKSVDSESSKPVKKLNTMEVLLDETLKVECDKHYSVIAEWRDQGYDSNSKYYYNVVNVSVTVRERN